MRFWRTKQQAWFAGALLGVLAQAAEAATVAVPTDYGTLAAAITALTGNGDPTNTIIVEPGTYTVRVPLISNLTLRGRETSRTFLVPDTSGVSGTAAALSASNVSAVQVSNFTFLGNGTGLAISGSSSVRVSNNVFRVGSSNNGLTVATSTATVENNTFYGTATALTRDAEQVVVRNNIFAANGTAIEPANLTANISFNGFFANSSNGATGTNAVTASSASFVNVTGGDFHLAQGSAAIDAGTGTDTLDATAADLGAFGGSDADTRPYPVQNLAIIGSTADSVSLGWERNRAYLVTEYRVYYGPAAGDYSGSDAAEGASPVNAGDVASFTLSGLSSGTAPAAPAGLVATPANNTLQLRWSAAEGATGYRVRYGMGSTGENQIDVGRVTHYDLTGLTNGTSYRVTVSALAQRTLHLAVTALDSTAAAHESAYSRDVTAAIGAALESLPSNEAFEYPEPIVPQPQLPNEGCFIATAAFGHYDALPVQTLRDFRDRYLLVNPPGRAFVAWYYRHSPAAARWLDAHADLKPAVRTLLLPAVAVSALLTGRAPPVGASVALFAPLLLVLMWQQRRRWRGRP